MSNRLTLFQRPIVDRSGSPTSWFAQRLEQITATVDGIIAFVGFETGQKITADDIEQGVENRVRQIVREEISYNSDGTVAQIMKKDATGAEVESATFSYNADSTVSQVVEVTPEAQVTRSFTYQAGRVAVVDPTIVATEIGSA